MAAGVEMIYWYPAAPTGKVGLQGFQWALGLLYVAFGPSILGLRFCGARAWTLWGLPWPRSSPVSHHF